jgi:hypothetical protein
MGSPNQVDKRADIETVAAAAFEVIKREDDGV